MAGSLKHQTGKFATCLGLALALTPLASAQQFQTPTLPGQSPTAIPQQLQARIQHAEALKAQMIRAQQEQGAPSEFAQKAYEAQQAYLAQQAYEEYMAYAEKQKQFTPAPENQTGENQYTSQRASYDPSSNGPAFKRLPKPQQAIEIAASTRQAPTQSTFVPPVHIAPTANFSDEPTPQFNQAQAEPTGYQQVAYLEPPQQTYQAPVPQARYAQATTQLPTYVPPQAQQRSAPQMQQRPVRQSAATPQRYIPPQVANSNRTSAPQQREYILQENPPVGLQDRITSLLSKPRYLDANTGQDQNTRVAQSTSLAQSGRASRVASQPVSHAIQDRRTQRQTNPMPRRARQPLYAPQTDPQSLSMLQEPENQVAIRATELPARRVTPVVQPDRDAEVRHAYQMQQRMERAMLDQRDIQQVALLEPAQDPFNDQSIAVPQSTPRPTMRASQGYYPPTQSRSNQQEIQLPPVHHDTPMRQISVLSQDSGNPQDSNQFGQPAPPQDQSFVPPSGNLSQPQEPLSNQSDLDFQKIDDELNRRLQEIENNPTDESSRVDDMVDKLEKELRENQGDQRDSVIDRGTQDSEEDETAGDRGSKPNQKTCDDFRKQLLEGSIRDIALDISPQASQNRNQYTAIARSWTDRSGNIIANGTMIDLRRGYVILDGAEGRQKIPYAKLSDADWAAVSDYWRLPELCSVANNVDASRNWIPQTYTWKASAVCHKPLFFENIQLERYGHTHGPFMQPIRSVGHFFVSLVTVPYQSGIHPANECQYALGFYRPGDCAPWLKDPIPFSLNGARRQALITTGVSIIP